MTVALGFRKKEIAIPKKTGDRIAAIIKKGLALKGRLEKIKQDIAGNEAAIIPHAEQCCSITGMNSATFQSAEGEVVVKFGNRVVYDTSDIQEIKEALGPIFSRCFYEIPSFAVNLDDIPEIKKKLGKDFDRLVMQKSTYKHTPEIMNVLANGDSPASARLRELVRVEDNKPSVSFGTLKE